jgi:hypothetical protein
VERARLTQGVYALFGLALLTSNLVGIRSGRDSISTVATIASALVVVAAAVGLVRPGTTVLGVEVGVGEQPNWVLALLLIGTSLLTVGTVLRL